MEMDKGWVSIFFLVAYIHVSTQMSTPNSTSYKAAVVEFAPTYIKNNTEATLQQNSDRYFSLIQRARSENVDIMVFPEDGLTTITLPSREKMDPVTTLIPPPSEKYVPCTNATINVSETLKKSHARPDTIIFMWSSISPKKRSVRARNVRRMEYTTTIPTLRLIERGK